MDTSSLTDLAVEYGNVPLVDLTRDGVALHVSHGVVREAALNRWFARHVPRRPWRGLTATERAALERPRGDVSSTRVFALDFPECLQDVFWSDVADALLSTESSEPRKEILGRFRQTLLDALSNMPEFDVRGTRTFDLMFGPPGAPSTAFDAKSGEYVGLHIDDHENLGFDNRGRGFQLLSINLGHAERYFQFVNHDTSALLEAIGGIAALPPEARSAASLVQSTFGAFPECPVLRMTLRPGQGYVAVTQDLIHDGATNDVGRPDVNCLLGGHFVISGNGRAR